MEMIAGVRPMTGRDIGEVVWLEQVCFSESWSEYLICQGLDSKVDTYLVYQENDRVLGYSVIRLLGDEGEIQRIAVDPRHQRRGIARKLMEAMVAFSRARGVGSIALEVRAGNQGARKLYEAYGFRQEAVRRGYYHNPREDALILWNREI